MKEVQKIFKIKQDNTRFDEGRKSIEATEDYAVKKVVNTSEGTVEKVPVNDSDIANKKYVDDEIDDVPSYWTRNSVTGKVSLTTTSDDLILTAGDFEAALGHVYCNVLNVDSGVLNVNLVSGRVGIGDTAPNKLLGLKGTNAQISIEESNYEFLRVGVGETSGTCIIGWDDSDTLRFGVYSSPTDTSITTHASISSLGLFTMKDVSENNVVVNGVLNYYEFAEFARSDTTPSVNKAQYYKTANTSGTSITTFDDGVQGQKILIIFNDTYTTLIDGATLNLDGSTDFTGRTGDVIQLVYDGSAWYEVSRSLNH